MRRTGHIRERLPGSFELRYSLGTDPATGKRRTATVTVRGSRKDADKELRRLLRAVDTGEHIDPNRLTVRDWLNRWLDIIRPELAPLTHGRYVEIVRDQLLPALGNIPLAKLAPAQIQTLYSSLATGGRRDGKDGGLSGGSRRLVHAVLRMSLNRAVELQHLCRNPCDALRRRLPKAEKHEMVTLSPDQAILLLKGSRNRPSIYTGIFIALMTGARRGEACALRWSNVDLDRGVIRVVESLEQTKGGALRFKAPKNGKSRTITLPASAIAELRQLKRDQAERLLRVGVLQDGATLLCAQNDGRPLAPDVLTAAFTRLVRSLGDDFPHIHYHSLRHSHATQLLLAGVHPRIAQERLGHATVAMTLDIYSHVTSTMQEDAAGKIDAVFRIR
jgi:integrase